MSDTNHTYVKSRKRSLDGVLGRGLLRVAVAKLSMARLTYRGALLLCHCNTLLRKDIMKTKDFVNIGVFTAIYYVIVFATGMLGLINPIMMFVGFIIGLIVNAATIALFKSRTPKVGALFIMGILIGALTVLTGHPWTTVVACAITGLAADLIMDRGRLQKPIVFSLGYAVLSLWYIGPWLPVLINADAYYQMISAQMGKEYADKMLWFLSPLPIAIWAAIVFVVAFAAGFFGHSLLRRHFQKAGVAK